MPAAKMYIVNSPDLVVSVQRCSKSLQFAPFAYKFVSRICNSSEEANRQLMVNVDCSAGNWGLQHDAHEGTHAAVAPGPALDQMNRTMLQCISASLDKLHATGTPTRINLARWLRHEVTLATSEAVFGPDNPFRDREVEDGFW